MPDAASESEYASFATEVIVTAPSPVQLSAAKNHSNQLAVATNKPLQAASIMPTAKRDTASVIYIL